MNMKKYVMLSLAATLGLMMMSSCSRTNTIADVDYPSTYDIHYALKKVMEYDPVNINGIDVFPHFDFFTSWLITIHVVEGKMTSFELSTGDVPFATHAFPIPSGKVDCYYDTESIPNALRIKDSDQAVAYFRSGQLYIPFVLDCEEISYEYTFKEVE